MAKDHITLLRKLSEIGKEVSTIAKSGHNERQNYDYAKEADFKRECRKPFFDRGLVLTPEILSRNNYDVTTGSGTVMHYSDVIVKYTVSDSETGESLAGTSAGSGFDAGDKAVYKAMAGAMKYWLATTFLIPTGDDPEDDSEKKNGHSPVQEARLQAAKESTQKPTTAPGAAQGSPATVPTQGAPIPGANTVLSFGKHNGETLADVYADRPDYVKWLAGSKDGKANSEKMQSIALAFLAAQPVVPAPLTWSSFWLHMRDLGLDSPEGKETIHAQAATLFNVAIDKLTDVIKNQGSLDLLDQTITAVVNSQNHPGPDIPEWE